MATIEQKLKEWQRELLDFSNRNRLINFRTTVKTPRTLKLVGPTSNELYEHLLTSVRPLLLIPQPEPPEIDPLPTDDEQPEADSFEIEEPASIPIAELDTSAGIDEARTQLSKKRTNTVALRLLKQSRASQLEQSVNILFASFGLLRWRESRPGSRRDSGDFQTSPLFLVPIVIEESPVHDSYKVVSTGEDPELNLSLVERLRQDEGIDLTISVDETSRLEDLCEQIQGLIAAREGWEIIDEVHIGIFQFHKIRMFRDLEDHLALAAENEVIAALADDKLSLSAPDGDPFPDEATLDQVQNPFSTFTPLDADASQLKAILAARSGSNLVLQGPPGTGKSQTIANIIAESIAHGKSVLFVSEKSAALEVVHKRLERLQLDKYCLMLHSNKATKRDVITDLGRRLLETGNTHDLSEIELDLEQLGRLRTSLDDYADALHIKRAPFNRSIFWANSRLAEMYNLQLIPLQSGLPAESSLSLLGQWDEQFQRLGTFEAVYRSGNDHPWFGIIPKRQSIGGKQTLGQSLTRIARAIVAIRKASDLIAYHLGLVGPTGVLEAERILKIADEVSGLDSAPPNFFNREAIQPLRVLLLEANRRASEIAGPIVSVLEKFDESIFTVDVDSLIRAHENAGRFTFANRSYKAATASVQRFSKSKGRWTRAEQYENLQKIRSIQSEQNWFQDHLADLQAAIGTPLDLARAIDSSCWPTVLAQLDGAERVLDALGSAPTPGFLEVVTRTNPGEPLASQRSALQESLTALYEHWDVVGSLYSETSHAAEVLRSSTATFESVDLWIEVHLRQIDELDVFVDAMEELDNAAKLGVAQYAKTLLAQDIPPRLWSQTARKAVFTEWVDAETSSDPRLASFRSSNSSAVRDKFRDLDRRSLQTAVRRIDKQAMGRQQKYGMSGIGEPQVLRREYSKQRRHMPIRKLFGSIPNLLVILKPCLMMSPLSVAQYLPANQLSFDLVIFDEASQVKPVDALGAIMRGKQLIVAGDSRQLPPSAFFDRTNSDYTDEDDQDITAMESILDSVQSRAMPVSSLRWHYRSRHEDLIAFSNRNIYDGQLITFPTPDSERTPLRGVHFEYVPNGLYTEEPSRTQRITSGRVNRVEARRVAELVMQHARTRISESLGVVALGLNQAETIEEELAQLKLLDQSASLFLDEDSAEPFFVKALEQVQGDERDVIIVSIGYGRNETGTLSHNFGPLNRDGGERRLNVLVTRAKHQNVLVSSIRGDDIELSRARSRGALLLKQYLDFAEKGSAALGAERSLDPEADFDSPFEEEVAFAIEQLGYVVHKQVGTSNYRIDLAIVDPRMPGRYLLGIECDGATYHSSKTARDRDRLRQEVLEGLGWQIHRVWSTDWIRNRHFELSVLDLAIEEAMRASEFADPVSDEAIPEDEPVTSPGISFAPRTAAQLAPYVQANITRDQVGDILSVGLRPLVDALQSCVSVEGPVHRDLAYQRLVTAAGFQRRGARLSDQLDSALKIAVGQKLIEQRGVFLWNPGQVDAVPRSATFGDATRTIGQIASEEIGAAMLTVVTGALSLESEQLIAQTARLFGYSRTGREIEQTLRVVLDLWLKVGNLEIAHGLVSMPARH